MRPKRSALGQLLPWLMLGLGMTLGILWMSWREAPVGSAEGPHGGFLPEQKIEQMVLPPSQAAPSSGPAGNPGRRPIRLKSRLA